MQAFHTGIANFSPPNFMIGYLVVKTIVINKTTEEIDSYVMLNMHGKKILAVDYRSVTEMIADSFED